MSTIESCSGLSTRELVVCACDWSVSPNKRELAIAHFRQLPHAPADPAHPWRDADLTIAPPEPVGNPSTLFDRLSRTSPGAHILVGLDLPIGLPRTYAAMAGIRAFVPWLTAMPMDDADERAAFFRVSAEPSTERPFYPPPSRVKGEFSREKLVRALGVDSFDALLRRCDRATSTRPRAESVFWTLGGKQVGRAAIDAWRGLIIPAFHCEHPPALWPFDGSLADLVGPSSPPRRVFAEVYPTEAYRHIGLSTPGGWSKRRIEDRCSCASALRAAVARLNAQPDPALLDTIDAGFRGEDDFDALTALLGMLCVLRGERDDGVPANDPQVVGVEGWILGQQPG